MRRKRSLLLSVGLAAALAGLTLAPVAASYPGKHNGRIAFGVRAADGARTSTPSGPMARARSSSPRAWVAHLSVLLAGWPHDRLLRRHERCLGDLDDARGREEPAPADPPRWVRDLPGLLAGRIDGGLRRDGRTTSRTARSTPSNAKTGGGLHATDELRRLRRGMLQRHAGLVAGRDEDRLHPCRRLRVDARRAVQQQVWVMDADGGQPAPLTSDGVGRIRSPTGARTVRRSPTTRATSVDGGIWVMDADGGNQHQLSGCVAATLAVPAGRRLGHRLVPGRHEDRVPARLRASRHRRRPV